MPTHRTTELTQNFITWKWNAAIRWAYLRVF